MSAERATIIDQAIGWHLRLAEANEHDWAEFVAWLEARPEHARAYDQVAVQDRLLADANFPSPSTEARIEAGVGAANDNRPMLRRWGLTAAAALVAVVAIPYGLTRHSGGYEITTRPGEQRLVALDDGTRIELSGGTALKLDHRDPRVAELERGEATFEVRHDAAHPFTLTAGGVAIRDLGTVFNVARTDQRMTVQVSEGSVMFRPDRDAVALKAGDALSIRYGDGAVSRSRIDPDLVGGWRHNVLSFDGQPLSEVAATLDRLYAANISVDGALSDRPFTGMVRLTGDADHDVPHLAELIGAKWRREGQRWILSDETPHAP